MTDKIRVGVIFGGRSGEHEVSLRSAQSVIDAINKEKYEVYPIGITKQGQWIAGPDAMPALTEGSGDPTPAALIAEPDAHSIRERESMQALTTVDVIFPVLHGTYGEDGTVQGLLELADIPYVGAGVTGSAVAMDKAIFKAVMLAHDIPILPYGLVLRSRWESEVEDVLDELETINRYPMFAKPANLGSSVGVSKARDRDELRAAIDEAAQYDRRIVVEQGIDAREIEVSVLGNDEPQASIPGEVVPGDEFYTYEDKYLSDAAQLLIPAPLSDALVDRVQVLAVRAFEVVDCAGLARVDFLLDKESEELYINEINAIPGFTSISMYPKLWEVSGIEYPELIDRLLQLALDRHAQKQRSKTTYG